MIRRLLVLFAGCWHAVAWSQDSKLFTEQEKAWIIAHPVINIAVDPNWRPLEYIEDGVYKGLSAEYLKAISKASGLQFRVSSNTDWATARESILEGTVDVLPAVSSVLSSPQLRKRIAYSTPYFVGSTLIVTAADAPVMFDPRQLNGKTVAIKGGGAYERNLRFRYPSIRLITVRSPAEALEKVANGEAYAAVDVDAAMIPILQQRYFDTLHVAGSIADMPAVASIGVRIEEQLLKSIIDKCLASLTAAETDVMMARWVDAASYGPPSVATMLNYYFWELVVLVLFLLLFAYLLVQAYKAQHRARISERDKAMLLAVMSHEIRTPMNAILSSVELLGRTNLSPEDAQLAQVAVTSANTLLELLDGALDFSKLEAERLVIKCRPADIRGLIKDAVSISEFRAQEKNLPLKTEVQWLEPLWLQVDALRVRQVLINLLSNAIKFTEAGEVKVTASFVVDSADATRGTLHVAVSDTGIGVSKRDQQRLFQAFTQADESVTRKFGGTGLGLTICRRLLFLMGGTVELSSELGIGTTIELLLPAVLAEPQKDESMLVPALLTPSANQRVLSILVVEDHPENQFVIKRQLQMLGHQMTPALTGQAGLDLFAGEIFDVILLDCNLPDIDGYTVARRIRSAEESRDNYTPIIAISAMVGPEHSEACFMAGIDGILTKPLRVDQLREIIDLWCDVQSSVPSATPQDAHSDAELEQAFFQTSRLDLEQILLAADECNWPQVARVAHRIVGAAMMLDVPEVVAAARALETLAKGDAQAPLLNAAIDDLQCALGAQRST